MKKRIIILGSGGFIGKYLFENLNELDFCSNYEIVGLSRNDCDLLSIDSINEALSNVTERDVIVFASAITSSRENSLDSMNKNMEMAKNISMFLQENKIKQLIFLSTVDVYGAVKEGTMIKESLIPDPQNYYSISKLFSEHLLKKTCADQNLPFFVLRLPGVYGKGDSVSILNKLLSNAKKGQVKIFGDGNTKRDFIFVGDVCEVIGLLINNTKTGLLNLVTGKSYSINDIVNIIKLHLKSEFNINFEIKYVPKTDNFDLIYDISLFKSVLPEFKCKDIKETIRLLTK